MKEEEDIYGTAMSRNRIVIDLTIESDDENISDDIAIDNQRLSMRRERNENNIEVDSESESESSSNSEDENEDDSNQVWSNEELISDIEEGNSNNT